MRNNKIIFILIILSYFTINDSYGQLKNKFLVWFIPSKNNIINGIAIGPSLTKSDTYNLHEQTINGINCELFGRGLKLILLNKHPFHLIDAENEKEMFYADTAKYYNIRVNGLNVSSLGTNSDLLRINGINISGLFSYTGKVNGISTSIIYNMSRELNGIGMSFFASTYRNINGIQFSILSSEAYEINGIQFGYYICNAEIVKGIQISFICSKSEEVNGVQFAIVNKTEKLKGFQFGLWNINEKRNLPFINFDFSKD